MLLLSQLCSGWQGKVKNQWYEKRELNGSPPRPTNKIIILRLRQTIVLKSTCLPREPQIASRKKPSWYFLAFWVNCVVYRTCHSICKKYDILTWEKNRKEDKTTRTKCNRSQGRSKIPLQCKKHNNKRILDKKYH